MTDDGIMDAEGNLTPEAAMDLERMAAGMAHLGLARQLLLQVARSQYYRRDMRTMQVAVQTGVWRDLQAWADMDGAVGHDPDA